MLGFDADWSADFSDERLREIAASTQRVLLTRDRALSELVGEKCLLVAATDPRNQLREVLIHFQLQEQVQSGRGFLTRCLECNIPLLPVKPHQVVDRVPGHLLVEMDEFYLCQRCERVYWKGSHWARMLEW